jgi:hypothetical protein
MIEHHGKPVRLLLFLSACGTLTHTATPLEPGYEARDMAYQLGHLLTTPSIVNISKLSFMEFNTR